MARTSFTLVMLALAGGMALLLGVVGLYGVIAYSVSQRRREIGIRMALGAQHQELTGMFVRHALLLTGIGVVCGLAAAPALTRLMSSLLFGVRSVDPVTYVAVSLGLVATAALASVSAGTPRRRRKSRRVPAGGVMCCRGSPCGCPWAATRAAPTTPATLSFFLPRRAPSAVFSSALHNF